MTSTDKNKTKPNKDQGRVAAAKTLAEYNRRVRKQTKKKEGSKWSEDSKDPGLEVVNRRVARLYAEPEPQLQKFSRSLQNSWVRHREYYSPVKNSACPEIKVVFKMCGNYFIEIKVKVYELLWNQGCFSKCARISILHQLVVFSLRQPYINPHEMLLSWIQSTLYSVNCFDIDSTLIYLLVLLMLTWLRSGEWFNGHCGKFEGFIIFRIADNIQ